MRQSNRNVPQEQREKLSTPSSRYLKLKQRKAILERKIARQRDTYYHQQTAALVQRSNLIAVETLYVSNMLKNRRLAYALSDVAMSDFIAKLKYKAARHGFDVCCIGTFEPTSQLCSACGKQDSRLKNLGIRSWICPNCGAAHDRDINAAKNILQIALNKGGVLDKECKNSDTDEGCKKREKRKVYDFPEHPNIAIVFSKELTRHNDPRYVIKDKNTGDILDDAQGFGYKTAARAKNFYKAKLRRAKESA